MTTLYLVTNENMTQSVLLDDPDGAQMALDCFQRSGDALAHEFAGLMNEMTTHLYTVDKDKLVAILQPVFTHTEAMKEEAAEEAKEHGGFDFHEDWDEDDNDLQALMDRDRE